MPFLTLLVLRNWKASGGHVDGTIFWRLCLIPTLIALRGCPEEFDWRLVHGDLFRPPRKGMLSVFLVFGTQIVIMTFVTLCKFYVTIKKKKIICLSSI